MIRGETDRANVAAWQFHDWVTIVAAALIASVAAWLFVGRAGEESARPG